MPKAGYYAAAQAALHQWGSWVRRPQFWANLRGTGMFALLPLPRSGGRPLEIRLDPFSRRLHDIVQGMDEREALVLHAYYVCGINWDSKPEVFQAKMIGRRTFYELLQRASVAAYNRARA